MLPLIRRGAVISLGKDSSLTLAAPSSLALGLGNVLDGFAATVAVSSVVRTADNAIVCFKETDVTAGPALAPPSEPSTEFGIAMDPEKNNEKVTTAMLDRVMIFIFHLRDIPPAKSGAHLPIRQEVCQGGKRGDREL